MPTSPGTVTGLLHDLRGGDARALDALVPVVYDALRRIAHNRLRAERDGHTLSTTALVHEVYLKLVDADAMTWQNRAHFYAVAARGMRQVLISYARQRNAEKRGGGVAPLPLEEAVLPIAEDRMDDVLALDAALERLEALNARHARIVECRYFAGLSLEETAEALGTSPATVSRDWRMARAWLRSELADDATR